VVGWPWVSGTKRQRPVSWTLSCGIAVLLVVTYGP
jgi:hypothetical protein